MDSLAVGVLLTLAGLVGYWASLRLHPYTKCQVCDGKKIQRGVVFVWSHRNCWRCHGSGRKVRWGVRVFMKDRATKLGGH